MNITLRGTMETIGLRIGTTGTQWTCFLPCRFMILPRTLSSIMINPSISSIFLSTLTIMLIIQHILILCSLRYHPQEEPANKQIIRHRILLKIRLITSFNHNKIQSVSVLWMIMTFTQIHRWCNKRRLTYK